MKLFDDAKKKLKKLAKCDEYFPCPLCYRCMAESSSNPKCRKCKAANCKHNDEQRAKLIKRDNFKLKVNDDVKDAIRNMEDDICK
jgi:hypothetical protein